MIDQDEDEPQLRFPEKLWCLVTNDRSGAIQWNRLGDGVIIDMNRFRESYLLSPEHFKTKRIASFIRQLNLYGFRKTDDTPAPGIKNEQVLNKFVKIFMLVF